MRQVSSLSIAAFTFGFTILAGCQSAVVPVARNAKVWEAKLRHGHKKDMGAKIYIDKTGVEPERALRGETLRAWVEYLLAGADETAVTIEESWSLIKDGAPLGEPRVQTFPDRLEEFYRATNEFPIPPDMPAGTYLLEFKATLVDTGQQLRETLRFEVAE